MEFRKFDPAPPGTPTFSDFLAGHAAISSSCITLIWAHARFYPDPLVPPPVKFCKKTLTLLVKN